MFLCCYARTIWNYSFGISEILNDFDWKKISDRANGVKQSKANPCLKCWRLQWKYINKGLKKHHQLNMHLLYQIVPVKSCVCFMALNYHCKGQEGNIFLSLALEYVWSILCIFPVFLQSIGHCERQCRARLICLNQLTNSLFWQYDLSLILIWAIWFVEIAWFQLAPWVRGSWS